MEQRNVEFDETRHVYAVNGDTSYISVTSLVHTYFASFDASSIIDGMMKKKSWPQSKYFGKTKEEIIHEWDASATLAQEQGTKLHADIESYYKGNPIPNSSLEYKYFQDFVNTFPLVPYKMEWRIYNEDYKVVGTLDMVALNSDGTLDLYDWKRSKRIEKNNPYNKFSSKLVHIPDTNYWHYTLQLNMYKFILESKYGKKIRNMYIVCFHPSNLSFERYSISSIESTILEIMKEYKKYAI